MLYSKGFRLATLVGVAAAASTATIAIAEPGSGITSQTLVAANLNDTAQTNHDRIKFQTKEPTDVRLQKLTFAPGARSGWHHHPGVLLVSVQSGQVTLTDHGCDAKTYGPGLPNGSVFVEAHDEAMQATSTSGAVAYVTIIVPRGAPSRIEDSPVSCP